jgi:hypothetical protein
MVAPLLILAGKVAFEIGAGIVLDLAIDAGVEALTGSRNDEPVSNIHYHYWSQSDYRNKTYTQLREERKITRSYQPPLPSNSSYRPYPQTTITEPPKRLPTEVDNQTATKTKLTSSISVRRQQDANEAYNRGVLKFNPLSTQYVQKLRKVPSKQLVAQFNEAKARGLKAQENKALTPQPIEQLGFLITTSNLAGVKGDGSFLCGLESVSALSQVIKAMNSVGLISPTNEIPTQYEEQLIDDDYKKLDFKGFGERLEDDKLKQLLGIDFIEELTENDFTIESLIKNIGKKSYNDTSDPAKLPKESIDNLAEFFINLIAPLFFRSGFHRFPAKMPEYLNQDDTINKSDKIVEIDDMLEFQEYLLKNLDSVIGEFPVKIKIKKDNKVEEIKLPNIAEALAEIAFMNINITQNSDQAVAIGLKNLVETVKGSNAAIVAQQVARGNAKYLGYKNKESKIEIPLTFTPDGESMQEYLQDSKQSIIGFENVDNDDLQDDLKQILIASQIVKAALMQPFKKGADSPITGDAIRDKKRKDEEKYDDNWQKLMNEYSKLNTASTIKTKYPNARIRDLSKKKITQ